MPATFLAASDLVCLLDRRASEHGLARDLMRIEFEAGSALLTSNYAVLAASLDLQRSYGVAGPRALAEGLLPAMHVAWATRRDHQLGFAALVAGGEHDADGPAPDLGLRVDRQVAARVGAELFTSWLGGE